MSPEETAGSVEMVLGMCGLVGPVPRSVYTRAWMFGATMRPFVKLP